MSSDKQHQWIPSQSRRKSQVNPINECIPSQDSIITTPRQHYHYKLPSQRSSMMWWWDFCHLHHWHFCCVWLNFESSLLIVTFLNLRISIFFYRFCSNKRLSWFGLFFFFFILCFFFFSFFFLDGIFSFIQGMTGAIETFILI